MKSREIVSCGFRSRCGCVTNSQSSNLTHESPLQAVDNIYTVYLDQEDKHESHRAEKRKETGGRLSRLPPVLPGFLSPHSEGT